MATAARAAWMGLWGRSLAMLFSGLESKLFKFIIAGFASDQILGHQGWGLLYRSGNFLAKI